MCRSARDPAPSRSLAIWYNDFECGRRWAQHSGLIFLFCSNHPTVALTTTCVGLNSMHTRTCRRQNLEIREYYNEQTRSVLLYHRLFSECLIKFIYIFPYSVYVVLLSLCMRQRLVIPNGTGSMKRVGAFGATEICSVWIWTQDGLLNNKYNRL